MKAPAIMQPEAAQFTLEATATDCRTASCRPNTIIAKVTQNGKKARILKECYKIQSACYNKIRLFIIIHKI